MGKPEDTKQDTKRFRTLMHNDRLKRISELNPETSEKLCNDLAKLVELEMKIHTITRGYTSLTRDEEAGLRNWIQEWFRKALEIAKEFAPREFAVSAQIGFPPRIDASFTWSTPKDY